MNKRTRAAGQASSAPRGLQFQEPASVCTAVRHAETERTAEYLHHRASLTLKSTAPALIYEEGDLIKRSLRDLYTRDIEEVLVEGDEGYRSAKRLMTMLMPSRARLWRWPWWSSPRPRFWGRAAQAPARASGRRAAARGRQSV